MEEKTRRGVWKRSWRKIQKKSFFFEEEKEEEEEEEEEEEGRIITLPLLFQVLSQLLCKESFLLLF